MTTKTIFDCARCQHLSECDAHNSGGTHKHRAGSDPCTPVIDAEKSNEVLQDILQSQGRNGSDFFTRAGELELMYQRK
ncbi:MAG: hypothetical protein WC379_07875 [Methanoregula sp.]|jgi:hypothetical protein